MTKAKQRLKWKPMYSALAVAAMAAALLMAAAIDSEEPSSAVAASPLVASTLGIIIGLLHSRRLMSVVWGTVGGLALGFASAWGLIGQHVADIFPVTLATIALFVTLGFLLGGFVEFVQFLHWVSHGNDPKEYRKLY